MDNGKIDRVLGLYSKFMQGSLVNKSEEALNYSVNERTIQRDIDDIRNYLETSVVDSCVLNNIIYDREKRAYRLEQIYQTKLTNGEILAICKILLDSRSVPKEDMRDILDKLVSSCVPETNRKIVQNLIRNEAFHYVEPRHKKHILDIIWVLGEAIQHCHYLDIEYIRTKDKKIVKRHIMPLAIMFSEYYFYLAAFIDNEEIKKDFDVINDSFPTIYRVDRIQQLTISDERFHIPYRNRFEEGEFRKRIQFMYGGKLEKITFTYSGIDVESILDRLPTAQIISTDNGVYTVSAEVFGKGVDMWIKSQGESVNVIDRR